jgi:hypothetical protein
LRKPRFYSVTDPSRGKALEHRYPREMATEAGRKKEDEQRDTARSKEEQWEAMGLWIPPQKNKDRKHILNCFLVCDYFKLSKVHFQNLPALLPSSSALLCFETIYRSAAHKLLLTDFLREAWEERKGCNRQCHHCWSAYSVI